MRAQGLPKGSLFGTFATCWYRKFDPPGVEEFIRKYRNHHLQQGVYLAVENPDRRDDDDVFEILASVGPEEVADSEATTPRKA